MISSKLPYLFTDDLKLKRKSILPIVAALFSCFLGFGLIVFIMYMQAYHQWANFWWYIAIPLLPVILLILPAKVLNLFRDRNTIYLYAATQGRYFCYERLDESITFKNENLVLLSQDDDFLELQLPAGQKIKIPRAFGVGNFRALYHFTSLNNFISDSDVWEIVIIKIDFIDEKLDVYSYSRTYNKRYKSL